MADIKRLDFHPLWGFSSKHLQIISAAYSPAGKSPPSERRLVDIGFGDQLSCEISTPPNWKKNEKTIVLIHGLGGSHESLYMIRMSRKLYERGDRVVRINLRGCGSGIGLSRLPYSAENSQDIRNVLVYLKKEIPESEIIVIGFSLGGGILLKLLGELGKEAENLIKKAIAVCSPLDLEQTMHLIQQPGYELYHRYYLKHILIQAKPWIKEKIDSIYEYDEKISGPIWGFNNALDYYQKCSSRFFLNRITCETHLIFAEDDPFISIDPLSEMHLPSNVNIWVSEYGSHMGFIGQTNKLGDFYWMDHLLLKWIQS